MRPWSSVHLAQRQPCHHALGFLITHCFILPLRIQKEHEGCGRTPTSQPPAHQPSRHPTSFLLSSEGDKWVHGWEGSGDRTRGGSQEGAGVSRPRSALHLGAEEEDPSQTNRAQQTAEPPRMAWARAGCGQPCGWGPRPGCLLRPLVTMWWPTDSAGIPKADQQEGSGRTPGFPWSGEIPSS